MARQLALEISYLPELKNKTQEELLEIRDIGPKVAESIVQFFKNEENLKMLAKLERMGLNFKQEHDLSGDERPLEGKRYVITGTLENYSRKEAQELLQGLGASVSSSVSSQTSALICGNNPGSKLKKARDLGIEVLDEEAFKKLIG